MPATSIQVEVKSRAALRAWLASHYADKISIWLVTYKKPSPFYLPYDAIVEEALCFGWIDSLPRKLDVERTKLRLSPRKAGSAWSKVNKDRVDRLIASGAMTDAGLTVIDRAKADGSWSKLDAVDALIEPDDLTAALDANPTAREHWDAFPRSAKRGILEWIVQAKSPETRSKRVAETARLAAQNLRANQWRQPRQGATVAQ
jgi:uncharacterized protein YdeI (YjbR/CyaY-like superfamily)